MGIKAKTGQFSHCSWKCLLGARRLCQRAQLWDTTCISQPQPCKLTCSDGRCSEQGSERSRLMHPQQKRGLASEQRPQKSKQEGSKREQERKAQAERCGLAAGVLCWENPLIYCESCGSSRKEGNEVLSRVSKKQPLPRSFLQEIFCMMGQGGCSLSRDPAPCGGCPLGKAICKSKPAICGGEFWRWVGGTAATLFLSLLGLWQPACPDYLSLSMVGANIQIRPGIVGS